LAERASNVNHFGRYLSTIVDEENRVNPVSLGADVAPANSWKLRISGQPSIYQAFIPSREG
jgi:hypothetical protein